MRLVVPTTYLLSLAYKTQAHGAQSYPPSRQWLCSGGASPNMGVYWNGQNGPNICSPEYTDEGINTVITDWSGVAQGFAGGFSNTGEYEVDPRSAHIAVMVIF